MEENQISRFGRAFRDNVKSIDFVKPQEQKQKENSEVSDNEKSEHTENNDENQKDTEHIEES